MAMLTNTKASTQDRAKALMSMAEARKGEISQLLPAGMDIDRMLQAYILNVKNTPKLLDCDPGSLLKALYTASCMGLEPNPYHGQLYLIPYGKEVQVIPGYKGLLKLVRNSGEVTSIIVNTVHEHDVFEYNLAGSERPVHTYPKSVDRGQLLFVYLIADFKEGGFHFEMMSKAEIEAVRHKSPGKNSTPWTQHFEEMAKKTVIRRAVKRLPIALSRELSNTVKVHDQQGRQTSIDMDTGEILDIDVW
jgi:recombination protein RecT